MATIPLLSPQRTETTRRALLGLAAIAGVAAGIIVLSSQVVTDFLREGPIRVTSIEGDSLQALLGGGALVATAIAIAAAWPRAHVLRLALAAPALAGGIFLIHALFIPAATLVATAVAVELSGGIPRERLRQFGPRRYPFLWGTAGILLTGAFAGMVVLSVWLLQPLFDEGETLNESLAFSVQGREQPPAVVEPDRAVPPENGAVPATSAATPEASGTLISRGELMGVDAFHTGSGDVLLVLGPEGNVILRFEDYSVRNGPDLHVYLTPDPDGDVHADGAVDLGAIKATKGFVNYDVPAGVDPTIFRAAVIYCQPFSVLFATAILQ